MPAVIRKGVDPSCGHCFSPRPAAEGSPNVFTNNIPTVRAGDFYPSHCCGPVCHSGNAGPSSPTVFVNGRGIHRRGDSITCGDTACNGSPNVFAGP